MFQNWAILHFWPTFGPLLNWAKLKNLAKNPFWPTFGPLLFLKVGQA
jgi:hypothetical protein